MALETEGEAEMSKPVVDTPIPLVSQERVCVDCLNLFVLSAGERRFYARKGLTEPKRCVECRKAKRDQPSADK